MRVKHDQRHGLHRPDLAYAVFDMSILSNSIKQQWDAEKWILGYLRGTANLDLVFQSKTGKSKKLQDHGDVVFDGDLVHRRSTTGYAD